MTKTTPKEDHEHELENYWLFNSFFFLWMRWMNFSCLLAIWINRWRWGTVLCVSEVSWLERIEMNVLNVCGCWDLSMLHLHGH